MSTKKVFASSTLSLALATGLGFTTLTVCATGAWAQCASSTNHVTFANTTSQILAALNAAASGSQPLVTADATGMSAFQLGLLGNQALWIADNGITGAVNLTSTLRAWRRTSWVRRSRTWRRSTRSRTLPRR